jgi:hypothetical protein
MKINGRYSVNVDTINRPNLRPRNNVDEIGLHTLRVFCYGVGSTFFKSSCVTVNLTITQSSTPHSATASSGPGPPHYRGLTITLRHTTLGRTPLDE